MADYFTKHHLSSHHKIMRLKYVQEKGNKVVCITAQLLVQGCVDNEHLSVART